MQAVAGKEASPRHPHRIRRTLVVVLALANLMVLGAIGYYQWVKSGFEATVTQIPVQDLSNLAVKASSSGGKPFYLLLVGNDTREGIEDLGDLGYFGGRRADVIMLVRIDPKGKRAQLVSFPRDLRVEDDDGKVEKLNATFSEDPNRLIGTISHITGIEVNHYVEVNIEGFKAIVDGVGGVTLHFDAPARDLKSHLDVPQAGEVILDGRAALAFARSREYQRFVDGEWRSEGGGDINRTNRQQQLIFAVLAELKDPSRVLDANRLARTVGESISTDSELDFDLLAKIGYDFRELGPSALETATLPVVDVPGTSFLAMRQPEADQMLTALGAGQPLSSLLAGALRLDVRNGNGVKGAATGAAQYLEKRGFEIVAIHDADHYEVTTIIARPNELEKAERLRTLLGFGKVEPGVSFATGTDVIVILGSDAVGQLSE